MGKTGLNCAKIAKLLTARMSPAQMQILSSQKSSEFFSIFCSEDYLNRNILFPLFFLLFFLLCMQNKPYKM